MSARKTRRQMERNFQLEYSRNLLFTRGRLMELDQGTLDALGLPSRLGTRRLAGLDLNKPRVRMAAEALQAMATRPVRCLSPSPRSPPQNIAPIDQHYMALMQELNATLAALGIAA